MQNTKKISIVFLQVVIWLIGIVTLFLLLWEPRFEGRNVGATLTQIYFHDPFLAYAYLGSAAFFVALYQAYKLLIYIRRQEIFSERAVKALQRIKTSALTLTLFILGAEGYFFLFQRGKDDIAGGVMMGLFLMFIALTIASAATIFARVLQNALKLKSENDLTV